MKVELSKTEVEMIGQALDAWEKQAQSDAAMGSMFTAIILGRHDKDQARREIELEHKKANDETSSRRTRSIMLRAKLIQAEAQNSEHELETH